mgnify:CR=1 FL=1
MPKISDKEKYLLLLMAYNSKSDLFEICALAILSHEDAELFIEFYNHFKNVYNFLQ